MRALVSSLALCLVPVWCLGATWNVVAVGLSEDARYQHKYLEVPYPGHPYGRPLAAMQVALEESQPALEAIGQQIKLQSVLWDGKSMAALLTELSKAAPQVLVLDLPAMQQKALMVEFDKLKSQPVVFNISEPDDELRGASCHPAWLHTSPSQRMYADALAQWLASRNWREVLLLVGPQPQDLALREVWLASFKRYGIKVKADRKFVLSGDPRLRDQGNTRLLTAEPGHDAVVVLDADGEFGRGLLYNTALGRPVVGSSGLVPLAWSPAWDRYGAPQLSHRFVRQAQRPMLGQDWAAWMAVKAFASALDEQPKATLATLPQLLKILRSGIVSVDTFKGGSGSFRPWDGQLRQPILLAHGEGVAAVAPLEGAMHPTEVLDTLGIDEKESVCKRR